jgi:hypothetical protein
VQSVRLERLGEGLVVHSGEMVAAYWVEVLAGEASASGNLVTASRMEDVVDASMGEPCLGF